MHKITLLLLLSIWVGQAAMAQADRDTAEARYNTAIAMMEDGKPAAAIPLLEEAIRLNSNEWAYHYEMAYSKYMLQDYNAVVEILKKLVKRKDINSRVYQLLGNAYDLSGKRDKALEAYEKGLKVFPAAGNLYLERGVMEVNVKDYTKAMGYFEKGIEVDPMFPSNYYWASKIFLGTQEEVWGMIYGEIFLNLERGSKRTDEISKQLYLTYKGEIQFKDDTSVSVSFSRENVLTLPADGQLKLPFGVGVYEPLMLLSLTGEKIINLPSLNRIRTRFVENYKNVAFAKNKPVVVLFDYEQQVKEAGYLEEYNYWILAEGDEKQFGEWRSEHKKEWEEFIAWFKKNPLKITQENVFYRGKY
ncbi:tetratricopeptide repeat protein [Chitinophaga sancti]|uniref:Tetratricopeptide repeat protein n=1 Tax=Chitinophaga sancti TaxID=1004 RepID=A0A1K1PDH1_9BACT|nr:tetratricopeptide repeat protein [Chitinophaga sancti]WQD65809.1 tetratricopeptide repeat protein [Chitinophaga sancti]WQG88569.1 tetratricopeptide repeat protein [Chitinophaga sancti]SFW45850.1 Tetratricopeptide repeat-containing protein [Chitinophaga sancti]